MPASLAIALVAVLAVGGPVVAYLVRSGAIQKWPRRYYESDVDDRVRNGIYGILLLSAMAALALLGIAAASRGGRWEYVTLACTLAGLACLLWSRRWIKHPPDWLQPEWRLAAERGQAMPNERTLQPRSRGKLEIRRAQYWLGWAGLLAIVLLSVVFGFSAGTFMAIGVALTYLLATRPRKT